MKKGFTLIELLVAITVFAVITGVAAGGFTNALHTQREISALISAQSNVSLAMEQIAREIRTGYLFCRDVSGAAQCTCVDGSACGVVPQGETKTAVDLNFYNAAASHVIYSLNNNTLQKSDPSVSGSAQALTGNNVSVKYLLFTLSGNAEGDHWTPRITISIGIAPSSSEPAIANDVLNLETSISARGIDCNAAVAPASC